MRTNTVTQRNRIGERQKRVIVKAEVETNVAGVFRDLAALSGYNWFKSARWKDTADSPNWEGEVVFMREQQGGLSLAPEMTLSPLNNIGGTFNPTIDGGRRIRLSTEIVQIGAAPGTGGGLVEVFDGYITTPSWGGRDSGLISCQVRDKYGRLMERITNLGYTYGTPLGEAIEVSLQNMLDAHPSLTLGPVTLWLPFGPPSPAVNITGPKVLPQGPLLQGMRNIADQIAWTVKPMYDDSTGQLRLAFYPPDRAKTVADFTLPTSEFRDIPDYSVPTGDVRNDVEVGFKNKLTGKLDSVRVSDPASQLRYDVQYMRVQEDDTNIIDTPTEATVMANAMLADLKDPYAQMKVITPYCWIGGVGDLIGFPANGRIFDTSRNLAVIEAEHVIEDADSKTTFTLRQQVVGAYKNWLQKGGRPVASNPTVAVQSITQVSATGADVVLVVNVKGGFTADLAISTLPGGGGSVWKLVTANGDPTPVYLTDGATAGPSDWWYDGTTYVQLLADYQLQPVAQSYFYAQSIEPTSALTSGWVTITLPGYQSGWGTGGGGSGPPGGPTPLGTSVDVIIPVLLALPSTSPEVIASDGELFVPFSYNPSPFATVRIDAIVSTIVGTAGKLELRYLDASSIWVPMATPVELDLTVGGMLKRGIPVPQGITAETWFAIFSAGGAAASLRGVWVTFEPVALSLPPGAWVPPVLGPVCNSSLSGTQDIGDDWCGYIDDATLLAAYNWVLQPDTGFGTWWSDYNEPTEDYEGKLTGYWNYSIPMAPDWWHCTMSRGLPFNGGSTAMVFDSADGSFTTSSPQLYIYGLTNQQPGGPTVNDIPGGGPSKVSMVSRLFVDPVTAMADGDYITPVELWFVSTGAFSEVYAYIGYRSPYPDSVLGATPHLFIQLWSYNTTAPNYISIDCGDASDILNDPIGYEFRLSLEVIPATSSAYDKLEAILSVLPLPGAVGTFAGTWVLRLQNLMAQDATVNGFYTHNNGVANKAVSRVKTGTYSWEVWTGNPIWLGGPPPSVTSTTDTAPAPADNTVVTTATKKTDTFAPRPPRGANTSSPVVPLPAPWTRFNDGGKIVLLDKDGLGHAQLQLAADGSGIPRGALLIVPQVVTDLDYTLTFASIPNAGEANSGGFMYMEESATGKWVAWGIHHNGTNRRMSVWKGTGAGAGAEVHRGVTNITGTSGYVLMERFSGQWYFHYDIGGSGLVTEFQDVIGNFFTTGPDRVGFGAWSGASGITVSEDALS